MEKEEIIEVGDIVTRDGSDENEVTEIDRKFLLIYVKCIKEPTSGWIKVGETNTALIDRYSLVRKRLPPQAQMV